MDKDILTYNKSQEPNDIPIVELLAKEITNALPVSESKVWHGSPVWFLDGNPIVGYARRKAGISLMFWSGQSFEQTGLSPEGTFKAAEKLYRDVSEIDTNELTKWLEESIRVQWDYKNIVKRKGILKRLK